MPEGVFILHSVKFITQTHLAPKDLGAMGHTVPTGWKKGAVTARAPHTFALHSVWAQFMARSCTI